MHQVEYFRRPNQKPKGKAYAQQVLVHEPQQTSILSCVSHWSVRKGIVREVAVVVMRKSSHKAAEKLVHDHTGVPDDITSL